MVESGRDELHAEFRRESLPVQQVWKSEELAAVVAEMSYVDLDALLAAIGEHHVSGRSVAQRVARGFHSGEQDVQLPATVDRPRREKRVGHRQEVGIHV